METVNENLKGKTYSAEAIKKICLDAGADDVGLVDLDRESVQKEKEGILHVYPLTRSIIAIITVNNRENIQSPARYVANEEYHHTGDRTSSVSREILRRLNRVGIRWVVVNKGWPMALDRYPGKIWTSATRSWLWRPDSGTWGSTGLFSIRSTAVAFSWKVS